MNPTSFSQILGNDKIKRQLSDMVAKRAVMHSLLFAGMDGIGKSLFAWALAAYMMQEYDGGTNHEHKIQLGQHPDVHVYHPDGKLQLHSIQALRQLSEEVHLPPYEASWKFFIIHEADRMLSYSANALLKTFEEPPPRTLIILLSHSQAALLPTILSRCSTLHFHLLSDELIIAYLKQSYGLDESVCQTIVRQSNGSLSRAKRLVEQGDNIRTYLLNLLAQGSLENYRILQESVQVMSENIEKAKNQAEENAKKEFFKIGMDQLSIHQQHLLEKELEGMAAKTLTQEAKFIFEFILSWYRDLHLLLIGGDRNYLTHLDFYPDLEQAVQRGESKPFHKVYQIVEESYLAFQRSTSLPLCLENLFLKLDLI